MPPAAAPGPVALLAAALGLLAFFLLRPAPAGAGVVRWTQADSADSGDVYVDPALRETEARASASSRLRVILLHDEPSALRPTSAAASASRVDRAALVADLHARAAFARRRAQPILDQLASEGSLRTIHRHWIVPATVVEATPAAIARLIDQGAARAILLDRGEQILPDDRTGSGGSEASPGVSRSFASPTASLPWGVSAIGAPDVWANFGIDGSGVLIAHLDTGVDYTHPDLAAHIWQNPAEIPGNGIDDDANGLVDDCRGFDFALAVADPMDDLGHGTHTAGTIVGDGTGGTATGVAPGATLMPLKVLANGYGYETDCWAALEYAVAQGADLVSMSLGWIPCYHSPTREVWRALVDEVTDAGILVVTAAGNEGDAEGMPWYCPPPNNLRTPADVPSALAVGACAIDLQVPSFSSVGPSTWSGVSGYDDYPYPPGLPKPDLCAPGVDVLSTVRGGGYSNPDWDGTSMACPHVTGAAALVLAANPGLSPAEVREILAATAKDIESPGFDTVSGAGLVDAFDAVTSAIGSGGLSVVEEEDLSDAASGSLRPPSGRILSFAASPNPLHPETQLRFRLAAAGVVTLAVYDARGRLVQRLANGGTLPAGEHAVRWDGRTREGEAAPNGVYWARLDTGGETATRTLILSR